jgi:hypothetical protein
MHLELSRQFPSCMLAYRRQLPPQESALLLRLCIACWASAGHVVCPWDWDEKDAFCNFDRAGLALLTADMALGAGSFIDAFYAQLAVHAVTPHGLAGPYFLLHGGGQGDSGGVAAYTLVGILRTRFHYGVLVGQLDPRDQRALPEETPLVYFGAHFDPLEPLLEVGFSDDRRPVGVGDAGAARVLNTLCHGCWRAGGILNVDKLRGFKLRLESGRLVYQRGTVYSEAGPIKYKQGGLRLVGVPCVMGEVHLDALQSATHPEPLLLVGVTTMSPPPPPRPPCSGCAWVEHMPSVCPTFQMG